MSAPKRKKAAPNATLAERVATLEARVACIETDVEEALQRLDDIEDTCARLDGQIAALEDEA